MTIWKKSEESIDVKRARQQAEIAKLQEQAARSMARAQMIQAKVERYRAITKIREKNGGIGIRAGASFSNVPDLPKKATKDAEGKGTRTPLSKSVKGRPARPSKGVRKGRSKR